MDFHGNWKFELKCHKMDLFHDDECTMFLVVQFPWKLKCFDVLSSKLCLVSTLEILLVFALFINIFFVMSLCLPKVGYKLCLNVHQPHALIFNCFIMLFTPWTSKLKCKPWFVKKIVYCVEKWIVLLWAQTLPWTKRYNHLCNVSIVSSFNWHVLFVHLFRGGKLIITSLSHLKFKKPFPKLGCKLRSMVRNDIFRKAMILKNMVKKWCGYLFIDLVLL